MQFVAVGGLDCYLLRKHILTQVFIHIVVSSESFSWRVFCIIWREDELIIHVDRHVSGHHVWEKGWDCVQMLNVGFHPVHFG